MMTKEEAKKGNDVLNSFSEEIWRIDYYSDDLSICDKLEALGFIEVDHRGDELYNIVLTDRGNRLKHSGGLIAAYEKEAFEEKAKKWKHISVQTSVIISVISILIAIASLALSIRAIGG